MKVITSKSQLETILKIIAEESVKKAYETIEDESKSFSKRIKSDLKKDRSSIPSLSEAEEEDEEEKKSPEEEAEAEEEAAAEPTPETPDEKPAPEPQKAKREDPEIEIESNIENHEFIHLKKVINLIRSGRSLKKDRSDEFKKWMERLGNDERRVMYVFFAETAKILHDIVTGEDAQNPEEEPIKIPIGGEPDEDENVKGARQAAAEKEKKADVPIAAGGPQSLSEIRRKVKELMSK